MERGKSRLENLVISDLLSNVSGLRVLVTGHTGFKGAWLCEWLLQAEGCVFGIALPPTTNSSLFSLLNLEKRLKKHFECDIRNTALFKDLIKKCKPDLVFHLAAQPLVRRSYQEPQYTWETNVMGTLNLLEAVRSLGGPVTVVVITSDKVYLNREWEYAYRENDELGGNDPYSASKAACEIAITSWRNSFLNNSQVKVATARSGNVIGCGDLSEDRIVPDCYRAWHDGQSVAIRNPKSSRPWQHVLEALSGYLLLAKYMMSSVEPKITTCNFGPESEGEYSVEKLVHSFAQLGSNRKWFIEKGNHPPESRRLCLCIERAKAVLGWFPRLNMQEAINWTDRGYTAPKNKLPDLVCDQIKNFEKKIKKSS